MAASTSIPAPVSPTEPSRSVSASSSSIEPSAPEALAAAPRLGEHCVHGDPVHPGPEARARLESRQAPPGLYEGLLGAVFSRFTMSRHAQAQPVNLARVKPVELLEGTPSEPRGGRRDQATVFRRPLRPLELGFVRRLQQHAPRGCPGPTRPAILHRHWPGLAGNATLLTTKMHRVGQYGLEGGQWQRQFVSSMTARRPR